MSILGSRGLHATVKNSIKKVREQGDPPDRDILGGENRYRCDVCRGSFERSRLVQCGLCGRWACRDSCFTQGGFCITCQGVVDLSRESVKLEIKRVRIKTGAKQGVAGTKPELSGEGKAPGRKARRSRVSH